MAWITISSLQRATDTWCCLSRNFLNINTPSAVDMHHQSGGAYLTDRTIRDHSYDWILYSTLLYACYRISSERARRARVSSGGARLARAKFRSAKNGRAIALRRCSSLPRAPDPVQRRADAPGCLRADLCHGARARGAVRLDRPAVRPGRAATMGSAAAARGAARFAARRRAAGGAAGRGRGGAGGGRRARGGGRRRGANARAAAARHGAKKSPVRRRSRVQSSPDAGGGGELLRRRWWLFWHF